MGLREEQIERRRRRIIAAARELIDREGMDGWSMRKVARAAGVSVPTLYNLFGSKEDIRAAICAGFFDDLDRGVEDTPLDRPLERAVALVAEGVEQVIDQAALTRPVLLANEQGRADQRRTLPLAVARQRAAMQAAIDQGLLQADLRPDLLATHAYEGFRRAALLWARGELDAAGFRAKALYAICVCLLAVATDESRPELLQEVRGLERELRRKPAGREARAG